MRGEYAFIWCYLNTGKRFTPTCVGNTVFILTSRQPVTVHPHMRGEYGGRLYMASKCNHAVHPHMRGEYINLLILYYRYAGSPPHAWGILMDGETVPLGKPVHPHMRGEYGLYIFGMM